MSMDVLNLIYYMYNGSFSTSRLLILYAALVTVLFLPHCPPLPYRADMSTPANSINPLEAIQRRALRIIFSDTAAVCHTFSMSEPSSCIFSLLPPPRDGAVTSRLRSASTYHRPFTRTKRFTSSVQTFPIISDLSPLFVSLACIVFYRVLLPRICTLYRLLWTLYTRYCIAHFWTL